MKNSIFARLMGYAFFIIIAFAVFFDPTEMALGSKLIELTPFMLRVAEIFGNVIWLVGVVYWIIVFGCIMLLFSEDVYSNAIAKAKNNPTEMKMFKKRWYNPPLFFVSFTVALIALGSGFWFTGSGWILALVLSRAVKVKVRPDTAINLETE